MEKENYLSDEEKELVMQFVGNNKMSEAVRKVLLDGIYNNGVLKPDERATPSKNFALALVFANSGGEISNELLGQDLKASAMGIRLVETAFNKMIGMALPNTKKDENKNQAR